MSRMVRWVALAALSALIISVSAALAGGGRGAGPRPQGDRGPVRRGADATETIDQALEKAGFTAAEREAIATATEEKQRAHLQLRQELGKLRQVANDPKASEEALRNAITSYRRAMERAEQALAAADRELLGKLSVRSQARALTLGLLDNGFGRGPMMGRGRQAGGRGDGGGDGRQARTGRGARGRPVSSEK